MLAELLPRAAEVRGQEIILIAAVVAAIGALYRQVIRPTVRLIRRIAHTVETVEAQMRPNGGTSIRDAIDQVLARIEGLEARLTSVESTTPPPKEN
jgi:hypothetical protein